ncbi:MAG: hypothetical protein ABIQ16_09770 [Polyangiaceae bacterium]
MKKISTRLGLGLSVFALAACVASVAMADAPKDGARPQCSGEHGAKSAAERAQHTADRFKKADKNADGFLTQAEVGDKKWTRIQVADTNKDGKVTQAELSQAHADGKLGHHGKRPA